MVHDVLVAIRASHRGCSSVVEHLLAKERVESSNLFIRFIQNPVQKGLLRVSLY